VSACPWLPESSDWFFVCFDGATGYGVWPSHLLPVFVRWKCKSIFCLGGFHRALFAAYHDVRETNMKRGLRIWRWLWHLLTDIRVWLTRCLPSGTFEIYPNTSGGAALLWFREGAVMWNSLHRILLVSNPNS
jgi:hypothetical protein